ncbi:MAG: hypothetical protein ACOCX9_06765 [Spirochaetota bacterium]
MVKSGGNTIAVHHSIEFYLAKLLNIKKSVFIGGSMQVGVFNCLIYGYCNDAGYERGEGRVFWGVLSYSAVLLLF